jgi:ligand-binding SRPBCC domain-containing protein
MKEHSYTSGLWLPPGPAEIFPFFADAKNLGTVTPPWLHFEILTAGHIEMRVGTLIDYRIRIHGIPVRWRTRITVWEPHTGLSTNRSRVHIGGGFTNTVLKRAVKVLFAPIGFAIPFSAGG